MDDDAPKKNSSKRAHGSDDLKLSKNEHDGKKEEDVDVDESWSFE